LVTKLGEINILRVNCACTNDPTLGSEASGHKIMLPHYLTLMPLPFDLEWPNLAW